MIIDACSSGEVNVTVDIGEKVVGAIHPGTIYSSITFDVPIA